VAGRRVAITGAAGQLGRQLVRTFTDAGDEVLALHRASFDLTNATHLDELVAWRPDVVINSAAWTDVDGCARDPGRAMAINGEGAGHVAAAAARANALAVQVSTNEVFSGSVDQTYREGDRTAPINAYGASKERGERRVEAAAPRHLIVRTAWLFGPGGSNFVTRILAAARRAEEFGEPLRVVHDEWGNPSWTPAVADALRSAIEANRTGIVHLCGIPPTTRLGWAEVALRAAGASVPVEGIPGSSYARASRAPARALLSPTFGFPVLTWKAETQRYVADLAAVTASPPQAVS
jgi:dTDP-4-dehydrorhamnose reductase